LPEKGRPFRKGRGECCEIKGVTHGLPFRVHSTVLERIAARTRRVVPFAVFGAMIVQLQAWSAAIQPIYQQHSRPSRAESFVLLLGGLSVEGLLTNR
jgi:hypothetical protein